MLHAYDGAESWEGLGFSVALLEDQNGDGKDEFVFGVPGWLPGPPTFSQGEIEVRSGADGTLLQILQDADGWPLSGTALARLDDVDGDGQEDLAFSAWAMQSLTSLGAASVHSGADWESALERRAGEVNYSGPSVGFALASAGDFDGDGRGDLAIGIPGEGQNHATSIGAVSVHSGPSGQLLARYTGYAGWDYFGYALAGIGDANSDGQVDLAVGAPTDPNNPIGGEVGWNRVHFVLSNYLRQHAHCLPAANSSGTPATIGASGKSSLAHNDLTLSVGGAPPAVNGLFFLGANTIQQSFGGGYKCVSGSVRRFPVQQTTAQGTAELVVDLTGPQTQAIQPGSSWSFRVLLPRPAPAREAARPTSPTPCASSSCRSRVGEFPDRWQSGGARRVGLVQAAQGHAPHHGRAATRAEACAPKRPRSSRGATRSPAAHQREGGDLPASTPG